MYCPFTHKYELVEWYNSYFNSNRGRYKTKKQLYAIWYKIAKKGGR